MQSHMAAGGSPALPLLRTVRWPGIAPAAAIVGGMGVVVGTLLPWITLFAGLHPFRGIVGWNGRVMLACGVVAVAAGIWLEVRDTRGMRRAIGALGLVLLTFTSWLLVQQYGMYRTLLAEHPMTVPGIGPGLFVAAAGALLITLGPLLLPRRGDPPGTP